MASSTNIYEVSENRSAGELEFVFLSIGVNIVSKIVQYRYTHHFEEREVYNLGFGDYNSLTNEIQDQVKSSNGDAYKVFHTVLSTIPLFFDRFSDAILMVQGSDGGSSFIENCKKICTKNCVGSCRKFNQRISIYRSFVEKHFVHLSMHYWFLGGFIRNKYAIVTDKLCPW